MRTPANLLFGVLIGLSAVETAAAKTFSVVTHGSETGIVLLDSRGSVAAYRLFERLNAPVETVGLRQTKIYAPEDKLFRIACSGVSVDYSCAVIVYKSPHAELDFETDRVELDLPPGIAARYRGAFRDAPDAFHFETEDGRLIIDWRADGMRIVAGKTPAEE